MDRRWDNLDDAALVTLTLSGEREAFGPLLLRYYPGMMHLCQRLLGSTLEAQDVAQEAALQAFLALERLHEPARFGAWLYAIAANLARMTLRRRRTLPLAAVDDGAALAVLWSDRASAPEEIHATREVHAAIMAALNELSPAHRKVVIGFYLDGYSYEELATLLGVPVSTVKGRLFFGRRRLRQALKSVAEETLKPDRRLRKERMMMSQAGIEVKIDSIRRESVIVDQAGTAAVHCVVVLRELAEGAAGRILPIWIGDLEAEAIKIVLEGRQPKRPQTHDLTLRLLEKLNAQVQQVVVNRLAGETFYAEVTLAQDDHRFVIDARPSDALALAVRVGTPIYVAHQVIDTAGGADDAPFWEKQRTAIMDCRERRGGVVQAEDT